MCLCFCWILSERGSRPGVRQSLLLSQHSPTLCYFKSSSSICIFVYLHFFVYLYISQHSPTLCYLKSVSSMRIFHTSSSEVLTRKIWVDFLFWIFCANKFENHVGGDFPSENASCYSRDLFPNANTGVDHLFRLIICFPMQTLFLLIICFQMQTLYLIILHLIMVDYGGSEFHVSSSNIFYLLLIKISVNCLSTLYCSPD